MPPRDPGALGEKVGTAERGPVTEASWPMGCRMGQFAKHGRAL